MDCDAALRESVNATTCVINENQVRGLPHYGIWSIVVRQAFGGRIMMRKIGLFTLLTVFGGSAYAQVEDISWKTAEVVPGIYMLEGVGGFAGGNLGVVTGEDGVVLIDDGIQPMQAKTVAAVAEAAGAPISFLINTHAHGDHTGANPQFHRQGATIVGHDKVREALAANDKFDAAGLPELTFNDTMTFHLNGHTAYVFHLPKAHTSGDAAIQFKDVNVIHTGDVLFNGMFPFIDLDGGGSVDGYIAGQQKILALADDRTKIIPGHGHLATRADLKAAMDMIIDAQARVKALVDAGKSKDEVLAANPLSVYDSWSWDFINTQAFTEMLYRSLTSD